LREGRMEQAMTAAAPASVFGIMRRGALLIGISALLQVGLGCANIDDSSPCAEGECHCDQVDDRAYCREYDLLPPWREPGAHAAWEAQCERGHSFPDAAAGSFSTGACPAGTILGRCVHDDEWGSATEIYYEGFADVAHDDEVGISAIRTACERGRGGTWLR